MTECENLADEVISTGFAKRKLGWDIKLDTAKMFIGGHALGGWTSILAAAGNQPYFKASLSFDPSHLAYQKEINENSISMKQPTCII